MNLFFWASPELFAIDRSKILFIGAHLLGTASTWFGSVVAIKSSSLESYPAFLDGFRNNCSDPSHRIKVRGLICNCKQGTRIVVAYSTEFRSLASESGFDDTAFVDQFLRGLSPRIMQYLMVSNLPESLEENMQIEVRVDNRLATVLSISDNQPHVKSQNPFRNVNPTSFILDQATNPQPKDRTVYMEIDTLTTRPRGPLSAEEKPRRYDLGLCFYCGGSGHIAHECSKKKTSGKARAHHYTESCR
ncbi:Retrotransposon-derived protein PEG10 [Smittium culicis]|uniref:Retrotransposon-derived protein PEG10 n=1 Tax=Smittium culicis TaxID=133412 RepID=A0A1R1XK00_9FUNG|nr:Retrotransposon-derived protein PEG10 [Smittium culicis]